MAHNKPTVNQNERGLWGVVSLADISIYDTFQRTLDPLISQWGLAMLRRPPNIVHGRDVRVGDTILIDGIPKTVLDVSKCNGIEAKEVLTGGKGFRTAIALRFLYTDGTMQFAHPAASIQLVDDQIS